LAAAGRSHRIRPAPRSRRKVSGECYRIG
jgi:hypothetical protein